MKKLFCVSDVHGFYPELITALNTAGFDKDNKDHIFVSCGDLFDRGCYSKKCLEFVNSLDRKILIRGNHEDLLGDIIYKHRDIRSFDYSNGTVGTIFDLGDTHKEKNIDEFIESATNNKELKKYFDSLVNYAEVGKYIFVHGWVPVAEKEDKRFETNPVIYNPTIQVYDKNWRDGNWKDARWLNGMKMWLNGIKVPRKTVVCGHWHTSWIREQKGLCSEFGEDANFDAFIDKGIVALDGCTAHTHKVNCVVLEVKDEKEIA